MTMIKWRRLYSTLADNLDAFHLTYIMEINIEKILRSTNVCKTAGIDDLLGHLLKDGLQVLLKPI